MAVYGFTDWDGFSPDYNFVGLQNYIRIFTRPEYWMLFKNSLYYFVGGLVQLVIAFLLAVLVNRKLKFKNFFKGVIVFPYMLNGIAIGLIFLAFFRFDGTLNSILNLVGLNGWAQYWITDANIANYSLVSACIWSYTGFNFIMFLGAMQSIPNELYEAAKIDGANAWQETKYIVLPSIKRIMEINMILTVAGAIKAFELPFVMTKGNNGTGTFVIQTMQTAFGSNRVGLAAGMAMVVLVIVIIVSVIQRKLFKQDI